MDACGKHVFTALWLKNFKKRITKRIDIHLPKQIVESIPETR